MLRAGVLLATVIQLASCLCPSGYTLQWHGTCTKRYTTGVSQPYNNVHNYAVTQCNPNYGSPVLIRSAEEQDYWVGIARTETYPLVLGLQCNATASKWQWDDGSFLDYRPPGTSVPSCSTSYAWYMSGNGLWTYGSGTSTQYYSIYCMKDLNSVPPHDDECADFSDDVDDGVCYQVGITAETWSEAQTICKSFGANVASVHNAQENSFIRRLAVTKGLVNGVILGATISGKSNNYSWIDGSTWDYDSFYPGFPDDGMGSCIAMDTNNINGRWLNVDCAAALPFACEKRPGATEPTCSEDLPKEGDLIYSPGYPGNASIPCDFFLKVATGKLVEVEIKVLEANSCCDKLVLFEGTLGSSVIATLTGNIGSGSKYRTKTSNMLRASWQPNGGVNVRGMMITFRGV